MSTAACPVKGCTFVAEHKTQNYANVLLGKHKSKVHGIRSLHQIKYGGGTNSRISESGPVAEAAKPDRVVHDQVTPNYCPNCGCNIRAVTAAMNLRGRS